MARPKKEKFEWVASLKQYRKRIKDTDGKYVAIYGATESELSQKLAAARAALEEAQKYAGNPLVKEYAEKWLESKTAGMTVRNKAVYNDAVRLHINPIIGDLRIQSVKPEDAEKVVTALAGKSASLQGKVLQTMKGIFDSAEDNEYIEKNPCRRLKNKGYKAKEKDALTDQQARTLKEAVKGTRAELFVLLGLYTGMRREEIMGLKWDCVHLSAETPHIEVRRSLIWPNNSRPVLKNELKSDAAERKIPLPDFLTERLKQDQGKPGEMVIGKTPQSYTQFRNLWAIVERREIGERTYRKSRVEKVEKATFTREMGQKSRGGDFCYSIDFDVTPHILRHTYITNMILGGADLRTVQYLAGHKDPKVTLKIYTHITGKQPKDTAVAVNKVFGVKNEVKVNSETT